MKILKEVFTDLFVKNKITKTKFLKDMKISTKSYNDIISGNKKLSIDFVNRIKYNYDISREDFKLLELHRELNLKEANKYIVQLEKAFRHSCLLHTNGNLLRAELLEKEILQEVSK